MGYLANRHDARAEGHDSLKPNAGAEREKKAAIRRGLKKRTARAHQESDGMLIVACVKVPGDEGPSSHPSFQSSGEIREGIPTENHISFARSGVAR